VIVFRLFQPPLLHQVLTDVRFKRARKQEAPAADLELEPRFQAIFTDERFAATSKAKVDKTGRKLDKQKRVGDEFREFYQVKKKDEEEQVLDEEEGGDDGSDSSSESDEKPAAASARKSKKKKDVARWGKEEGSSSSSSSESDEEGEERDELLDAVVAARSGQGNVAYMEDGDAPTRRLACVNVNWDLLGAVDILALVKSFCPPTGAVRRVAVYPSKFGKERMALEDVHGPMLDLDEGDDEFVDAQAKKNRHDNALRKYELERRRYFFAVIECDAPETAAIIYRACDGLDVEETASVLDLRYVPDDEAFAGMEEREVATTVPQNYAPPETALDDGVASTRVEINWDVTPAVRTRVTMQAKKSAELDEMDFAHLLASEGSDEEDDHSSELRVEDEEPEDEKQRERERKKQQREERVKEKIRGKYAVLLEGVNAPKAEREELMVTFQPGLEEDAEEAIREKAEAQLASLQTPFERKQAEKATHKKEKKAARMAKIEEEVKAKEEERKKNKEEQKKKAKKNKKGKRDREDDEEVGEESRRKKQELELLVLGDQRARQDADAEVDIAGDDRFASLLTKPELAIDKTDQRFKSSKSMEKLLGKMREKRPTLHVGAAGAGAGAAGGGSMDSLVASVKSKAADKLKKRSAQSKQ
jgi:hypothetical protein